MNIKVIPNPNTNQNQSDLLGGLYTTKQAATLFQVCYHTIRRWELRGLIKPARICRRKLFRKEDLEALLQNGEADNTAKGVR